MIRFFWPDEAPASLTRMWWQPLQATHDVTSGIDADLQGLTDREAYLRLKRNLAVDYTGLRFSLSAVALYVVLGLTGVVGFASDMARLRALG